MVELVDTLVLEASAERRASSSLAGGTRCFMRMSYNGIITAFQAEEVGSIPIIRSKHWVYTFT